jgi:hypothetical protein
MSNTALKIVTERSPEREALAVAIDRHRDLSQQLTATKKALDDGWQFRSAARSRIEQAEAAIEEAKTNTAKFLTDTALGVPGDAPMTVRAARDALEDAKNELEALLTVEAALKKQQAELTGQLAWVHVDEAYRQVVCSHPGVLAVFARYKSLQRELAGHRLLVEALSRAGAVPDEHKNWHYIHDPNDAEDVSALIAVWQASLTSLRTDPDAELPTTI